MIKELQNSKRQKLQNRLRTLEAQSDREQIQTLNLNTERTKQGRQVVGQKQRGTSVTNTDNEQNHVTAENGGKL